MDIKTNLADLVEAIIAVPGDFKVRIGMANPLFFQFFQEKLARLMQSDKVYKFLHIPVQAGSNHVLEMMRRGYTVEDYNAMVSYFQEHVKGLTIATDIIVGHPGESEEDFEATLKLLREQKPQVVKFSGLFVLGCCGSHCKGNSNVIIFDLPHNLY